MCQKKHTHTHTRARARARRHAGTHARTHAHTHTHTRFARIVVDKLVFPVTDGRGVFHVVDVVDEFLPVAVMLAED